MGLIKQKWGLALLTFNVISNVFEFMDVWYLSNIFEQSSLLVCPKSMTSGLAMFSCVSSKMHDFFPSAAHLTVLQIGLWYVERSAHLTAVWKSVQTWRERSSATRHGSAYIEIFYGTHMPIFNEEMEVFPVQIPKFKASWGTKAIAFKFWSTMVGFYILTLFPLIRSGTYNDN